MSTRHPARERLVGAASDLFYRQGIHATGIDEVIAHAGVAKASLYNNFDSKDDLVVAYLRAALERGRSLFAECLGESDPAARLRLLFTRLLRAARGEDFAGCPFANAAAELEPHHRAWVVVREFDQMVAEFFAEATVTSVDGPLVRQLVVCYVGALHGAKVRHDPQVVFDASELALATLTRP